jgi:hypothetical protein
MAEAILLQIRPAEKSADPLPNCRTGNCCSVEPDLIEAADIEE